jgi:hypothetical protein
MTGAARSEGLPTFSPSISFPKQRGNLIHMSFLSVLSGHLKTDMLGNSQAESEQKVQSWGFAHVFTWTDGP